MENLLGDLSQSWQDYEFGIPGGVVALFQLQKEHLCIRGEIESGEAVCSCITGTITEEEYSRALKELHFEQVYVKQLRPSADFTPNIFSAFISTAKPLR